MGFCSEERPGLGLFHISSSLLTSLHSLLCAFSHFSPSAALFRGCRSTVCVAFSRHLETNARSLPPGVCECRHTWVCSVIERADCEILVAHLDGVIGPWGLRWVQVWARLSSAPSLPFWCRLTCGAWEAGLGRRKEDWEGERAQHPWGQLGGSWRSSPPLDGRNLVLGQFFFFFFFFFTKIKVIHLEMNRA